MVEISMHIVEYVRLFNCYKIDKLKQDPTIISLTYILF